MSKWRDRLGRNGREVGVGLPSMPLPETKIVEVADFTRGLELSGPLTQKPRLLRAENARLSKGMGLVPGYSYSFSTNYADLTKHTFEHVSLDGTSEVLFIHTGGGITRYRPGTGFAAAGSVASMAADYWTGLNYAGDFLLSDGAALTYWRTYGAAALTDISAEIVARTFATAFGRIFAGRYVLGGSPENLGIAWNAANGDIDDWTGLGSNLELLLSDQPHGADEIMRLVPLGLDQLIVLCRRSIWIGRPTGDPLRPADFRVHVQGIGCKNIHSVQTVQAGIIFESDRGIELFDGNTCRLISRQLGTTFNSANQYRSAFLQDEQTYFLMSPFGGYICQFLDFTPEPAWFQVTDQNILTVLSYRTQLGTPEILAVKATQFGSMLGASSVAYSVVLGPLVETAMVDPVTVQAVDVDYVYQGGVSTDIAIVQQDQVYESPLPALATVTVIASGTQNNLRTKRVNLVATGQGLALMLSGSMELRKLRIYYTDSGHELTAVQ